jgi:hypothetical protein
LRVSIVCASAESYLDEVLGSGATPAGFGVAEVTQKKLRLCHRNELRSTDNRHSIARRKKILLILHIVNRSAECAGLFHRPGRRSETKVPDTAVPQLLHPETRIRSGSFLKKEPL